MEQAVAFPPGLAAEQEAVLLQPGDVVSDRFQVLEVLGFGALGAVYRVKDRESGEVCALKVILPSLLRSEPAREWFLALAAWAQRLPHEAVVPVYETGEDRERGIRYLTMEYVEGIPLDRLLRQRGEGRLTVREAVHVVRQICEVLDGVRPYAVHGDLKPRNILVRPDWVIAVLDFGLVKIMSPARLADAAEALGAACYYAPETGFHAVKMDARSDVYSMGAILYLLLTGQPPEGAFPQPSALAPEVHKALDDVVLACLDADPEVRPEDAAALCTALDAAMDNMPEPVALVDVEPEPAPEVAWERQLLVSRDIRWGLSHRAALGIAIAAALVGVALLFVGWLFF